MERQTYLKPEIVLFALAVEQGFAISTTGTVEGFDREDWNE